MITKGVRFQSRVEQALIARFMGPTWGPALRAHLGPTGPRWTPCWPHEPCDLGGLSRQKHSPSSQGLVLPWRSDDVACRLASGSTAFIWKLLCYSLRGLRQRHATAMIQAPGFAIVVAFGWRNRSTMHLISPATRLFVKKNIKLIQTNNETIKAPHSY